MTIADPYAEEYTALMNRMVITRSAAVNTAAQRLIGFIDQGRYKAGCDATGVPQIWAAASFEREASSNFNLNAGQGWPLHSRSQWVPYNGPFATWTESQIAAYKIDGLDQVGTANWTWQLACWFGEKFNGFGPRMHGIHTGYLWAGSNNYTSGKYVKDGPDGWSAGTVDEQLGIIPMMFRIIELRPDLDMPTPWAAHVPSMPVPLPAPVDGDVEELQAALNKLGAKLDVDGNYGNLTMNAVRDFQKANNVVPADGLSGKDTWAAIQKKVAVLTTTKET